MVLVGHLNGCAGGGERTSDGGGERTSGGGRRGSDDGGGGHGSDDGGDGGVDSDDGRNISSLMAPVEHSSGGGAGFSMALACYP